jgi:DNA adenine methylase
MSYQGGKQRLGRKIYNVIKNYDDGTLDYLEPFVGFCGVIKHVEKGDRKLVGCDINENIIMVWKGLQNGWTPPKHITKEEYLELKNSPEISALKGFAGIACSYGGIYFCGYRGIQRFKRGDKIKKVYSAEMCGRSLSKIKDKIKNVKFICKDYRNLNPKNKLIYCDPPYKNNDYRQNKYFKFDTDEFWEIMRRWSKDNIVIISEYQAPDDFECIWSNDIHTIHNKKSNIKTEKLFMYNK